MSPIDNLMPTSPDHNAERLAELKRLFPDLFNEEGQLDADELKKLTSQEDFGTEKYRFSWYGKSRAKRKAFSPSRGALVYDEGRSVNPELADGNMIIEGENLEVLKLLTSAYQNSVKCIYIDPPYNTGNDFIYPDNYTQDKKEYWEQNGVYKDGVKMDSNPESSGRFHSDWMSMMYSRLLVSRLLLKEDGVIFVSIDDNEVHNLRKIMDDVYGEENFIANIIWHKKYAASNDAKGIPAMHDHIVAYQKSEEFKRKLLPRTEKQDKLYKYDDNDGKGRWRSDNLSVKTVSESYLYEIKNPKTGEKFQPPSGRCWLTNEKTMQTWIEEGRVFFGQDGNGAPQLKRYLAEVQQGVVPTSLWSHKEVGHTDSARKELKRLFDEDPPFDNPKPTELLKKVIRISMEPDDLGLDFFAGSGTFGQAITELNNENEGQRRFILLQLPEAINSKHGAFKSGYRKISEITIDRVKRAISDYDNPRSGFGFKTFRLSKSSFPRVDFQPDPDKSDAENVEALKQYINEKEHSFQIIFDRDKVFDEVVLKQGFKLNYKKAKSEAFANNDVFLVTEGERQALICLDTALHESTVGYFKSHSDITFICLERALDTTRKWNLLHNLGDRLKTI